MHLACSQGHLESVKIILKIGNADINMIVKEHGTPLHCASKGGKVQIVSYLLLQKARIEYINRNNIFDQ